MKESKLTKKEIKKYEKDGILTIFPICIDCAREIIYAMTDLFPDTRVYLHGINGVYDLTFVDREYVDGD